MNLDEFLDDELTELPLGPNLVADAAKEELMFMRRPILP